MSMGQRGILDFCINYHEKKLLKYYLANTLKGENTGLLRIQTDSLWSSFKGFC